MTTRSQGSAAAWWDAHREVALEWAQAHPEGAMNLLDGPVRIVAAGLGFAPAIELLCEFAGREVWLPAHEKGRFGRGTSFIKRMGPRVGAEGIKEIVSLLDWGRCVVPKCHKFRRVLTHEIKRGRIRAAATAAAQPPPETPAAEEPAPADRGSPRDIIVRIRSDDFVLLGSPWTYPDTWEIGIVQRLVKTGMQVIVFHRAGGARRRYRSVDQIRAVGPLEDIIEYRRQADEAVEPYGQAALARLREFTAACAAAEAAIEELARASALGVPGGGKKEIALPSDHACPPRCDG